MYLIDDNPFTLDLVYELILKKTSINLSNGSREKIISCREYLDNKIKSSQFPIYGVNTGFGSLCDIKISSNNLKELQENLVRSHACGTGEIVPKNVVRLMILLKIKALSHGYSGVQLKTVERLIDFYNLDATPVVYSKGSLGASGDLAPLAHIALSIIGEGEIMYRDQKILTSDFLKQKNMAPISLQSKEGLALLNGTQFMSAYAIHCLLKSFKLSYLSDLIASLSLDAFDCRLEPFNFLIHELRPHNGQLLTAKRISKFLSDSALSSREKKHVQDPYSFRCIPQVHGATKDTLNFVRETVMTEINSVTDNPNIFYQKDLILSGGNFHGQPLAYALDFLKISMSELGSISERRIFKLISGERNLPCFLTDKPGLNSGLMIPQYTAASIVSANKQLSTPASVDSIVSSNGQEDHVSMGANAAIQANEIVENTEQVLAIELLNASQALWYREDKTSLYLENILSSYRKLVPKVSDDRILHYDIQLSVEFLRNFDVNSDIFS
tara:strand:- start:133 stop:1629 length:1497 start_codon:yes stop_codon:yes gene_type:complete